MLHFDTMGSQDFHAAMDFTLEVGGDSLNFLDLSLHLTPVSSWLKIEFDVYRKNTYSGVSIHNQSLHPRRQKLAIVNYAIHRLLHLPLSQANQEKEIRHIEDIALHNCLHLDVPAMVRRKSLRLLLQPPSTPPQRTKWVRLPFPG